MTFALSSRPKANGGLSWEFHLLDTEKSSVFVKGVVDVGKVQQGRALSNSAEFVVNRTMANADPSVVGSEVGDWNATQMGANCRADEHLSTSCLVQANLTDLVEHGCIGEFVFFLNFLGGESPNEDGCSVPNDL